MELDCKLETDDGDVLTVWGRVVPGEKARTHGRMEDCYPGTPDVIQIVGWQWRSGRVKPITQRQMQAVEADMLEQLQAAEASL